MEFDTVDFIKKLAPSSGNYTICSRCVMDSSASNINFDENGTCNFCREFEKRLSHITSLSKAEKLQSKDDFVNKIKSAGIKSKYDCVVGVSGGADSSWALYTVVKEGLRPLAVHMDNGWNREIAANNIKNLVTNLGVDLYTHVIDWQEYRNLMQCFFDADVIDIELLYDNAMRAVNYNQALKYNTKYILSGVNLSTEGLLIPRNWNWFKMDRKNIYAINRQFGNGKKITTFPAIGFSKYLYARYVKKVQWVSFLDYFEYDKAECMEILENELGFKPYPYKHYESIFTRFYQGYILPVKFGVDKRKVHFSALIISGQLSREDALQKLEGIPYPSELELKDDIEFFLKKMRWSENDLQDYLTRPEKSHLQYGSELYLRNFIFNVSRFIKKFKHSSNEIYL